MKRNGSQTKKSFWIVLGIFLALTLLVMIGRSNSGVNVLSVESASTTEERVAFLGDNGWEVDIASEEEQLIHIPEHFTAVYQDYNDLQLQQGYDLSLYGGRDCTLYSYTVLNYPDPEQTVIAHLYIYRNRIIGGDIHSTNLNGFMIGIK